MHIGNILKNTTDGSVLGAIVYTYPEKLIIFRNINGLNPGIFKMPIQDMNNPYISTVGNINESEFEPIKKALLKYYRRPTLPETEKAVFSKIIEFAFPNGVPLYDELAEKMPDESTRAIRLGDHLQPGKCLYINSSKGGPFEHLDNQCIYVLAGDEHGIWVCPHQTGSDFNASFLPFKDRNVPKFWSVNRLLPGEVTDNRGMEYVGKFLQAKSQNDTGMLSQIHHGDTRMKVQHDPKTGMATIVIPQKMSGQIYDFMTGTIKPAANLAAAVAASKNLGILYDNEPLVKVDTDKTKKSSKGNDKDEKQPGCEITAYENESITDLRNRLEALQCDNQSGGDDYSISGQSGGMRSSEKSQLSDELNDNKQTSMDAEDTNLSENASDAETDDGSDAEGFTEKDLIFLDEDEPIIEVEKVQKIRQMAVPELEKVFKESIQKGHIFKQKLEKIPVLLRDNPYYKDRVVKDVNLISLLKAQMTTESRMVLAQPADYHPLIETMIKTDYTNHFLVPLVVTTKKLYLTKKDPISKDDLSGTTATVEPDFHKYMSEWSAQNARGGMRKMVDINENLTRIMTEAAPHLPAAMSHLGLMVRFGEGIRPADQRNQDTTVKLKTTRAQEGIQHLAQATQVIRFGSGGREFALRNFELDSLPFDSHVVLGPLANYSNVQKTEYTISEIEAMEEEVDKNIAAIGSVYNIHYLGDNTNLVGFVRPPVMNFLQGRGENQLSLAAELSAAEDKGQIVIHYLDANEDGNNNLSTGLDEPDKFVVYLFQDPGSAAGSGPSLTDDVVRGYLNRMVPKFQDITRLFADTYRVEQPGDLERLIEILYKFDYIIPHREGLSLAASRTQPETHLRQKTEASYENIQALNEVEDRIVRAMISYNNKMDKIHRLRKMRDSKTKERDELKQERRETEKTNHIKPVLITDEVIELADKIYAEKYADVNGTGTLALSDESRMDYYAHQTDRSQYINLLLRKMSLLRMQDLLKVGDLESNLTMLKAKYEASGRQLPADLTERVDPETLEKTELGKCAGGDAALGGRKPKILKYPNVARMKEDNGRNATTPSGDLVLEGDYALIDEAGKKLIFRRERLNDGDYWIGQPLSALEQLLYKKRATCAAAAGASGDSEKAMPTQEELDTARAAMRLPEEQLVGLNQESDEKKLAADPQTEAECMFDLSRLQCLPVDIIDMDRDLAQLHARIMDINGQLAFARAIPPLIAECEKSITAIEKEIRNYNHGITLVEKYYTALVAQQQKELEAIVKRHRDCPHFGVIAYLDGLLNLSDQERYLLIREIIQRFQNQEQAAGLDLLSVSSEGTQANNVACFVCNQSLMCKHYLFALELMENSPDGMLDEVTLRTTYGELQGGTYYCKSCGAPLGNTEVLDIEEFEKDGGKEGMHTKTREVMEDISIIERQKAAVDKIITAAINDDQDDDMKTKLRMYKLAKDLLSLPVMSVDDELAMVNFMKTYEFIPRKTFYNLILLSFIKAKGGQAAGAGINKAAIDTMAGEKYWRHVACDILGHLLVIIQTSMQTYTVFNKLCATNNYMGWPLLGTGLGENIPDEDQGGIEIMFCVLKQIAILPEFKFLAGSEGGEINALRGLLIKRIDDQVRNNELVRTRLDRALDTKYNQITLMEEFRMSWTNYWPSYRPVMAGTIPGGVKWTPARDLEADSAKNWTAKGLRAMLDAGWDNIAYQSQVLAHNLTTVIEKESPANRIMLMNTVANSCCPIDYAELRARDPSAIAAASVSAVEQTGGAAGGHSSHTAMTNKSKFLNPEINYYMKLEKTSDPIRNALKRIAEYSSMIKALEMQVSCPRVRVVFPYVSKDYKAVDMTLTLEQEDLKAYFLKYIDSGPFKGSEHIFDPFGRCIISGAIKKEVSEITYTQTDFEKLLKFVERQKLIREKPQLGQELTGTGLPEQSPDILIRLFQDLKSSGQKHVNLVQLNEMAPKLIQLLEHDITLNKDLQDLTRDLELLSKLQTGMNLLKDVTGKRASHLGVILDQIQKLSIARLNEVLVGHLGTGFKEFGATSASKVTNRVQLNKGHVKPGLAADFKKEYYGLLTLIDTEKQTEIGNIVDAISGTKKEELGLEQTLINLGELRDIGRDIREFMERQARIVPHYEYVNHDREQEVQHHIIRGEFIRKLISDTRYVIMLIKNDAWADLKTAHDIPDYLSEFFKYKDAGRLFRDKFGDLAQQLGNLSQHLDEINEGSIFGAELVDSLQAYLFVLLLGIMIAKVGDVDSKKEVMVYSNSDEDLPQITGVAEDIPTTSDNEFDFIAAVDKAKGLSNPDEELNQNNDGNIESNELELYPEFVNEGAVPDNEPGVLTGGARNTYKKGRSEKDNELDLPQKAKEVKTTQRRMVIDFVRDLVLYAQKMTHIYNEMNLDRIKEQMARSQEKQTKLNLAAPKFLKQEGMEDDYRMVMNLINLGFMKYKDLNAYMQDHYGDEVFHHGPEEEYDARGTQFADDDAEGVDRDEEARRNKYGLDNAEMAEMGYVGAMEDMEEMDYGYMGVDEN